MSTLTTPCARDLAFDPIAHEYRLPDGRVVPSVTQILRAVGVSTDFEGLGDMSSRLAEQIAYRRDLGTAVHADCHAFDDDDLEWASVDPRVEPFVRAWATFRENTRLQPLARERKVFHPIHLYAGTLDGVFLAPDGHRERRILIDIKIGDPFDAGCAYQTAAYQAAYQLDHPDEPVHERWAVQLTPDCAVPYRVMPYESWTDFANFQAFVATYWAQAERRKRSTR